MSHIYPVGPIPVITHTWEAPSDQPSSNIVFFEAIVPKGGDETVEVNNQLVREYVVGCWAYGIVYDVKIGSEV